MLATIVLIGSFVLGGVTAFGGLLFFPGFIVGFIEDAVEAKRKLPAAVNAIASHRFTSQSTDLVKQTSDLSLKIPREQTSEDWGIVRLVPYLFGSANTLGRRTKKKLKNGKIIGQKTRLSDEARVGAGKSCHHKQESAAKWKPDSNCGTTVVVGASGGIGTAIALGLAKQGRSLCLVGRNAEKLDAVVRSAKEKDSPVLSYQADFSSDEDVKKLARDLQRDLVSINLLIHSAGSVSIAALKDAALEDLDWQYRVNVRAPYQLTQALLPMIQSPGGQIVFLNSLVGLSAKGGSSQYSMAKHALKALADSLRQEVNSAGIRVLSVFLGRTATPMQAEVHRMEGRRYSADVLIEPTDVARMILTAVSLSRTAEVTDITIRHSIKSSR